MTKVIITVRKEYPHQMYLPKEIAEDGFTGKVALIANAVTVVMVKDGVLLKDIKKSLQRIIEDLEQREQMGLELFDSNKDKKEEQVEPPAKEEPT
jgi:hypothetical protein